MDISTLLAIGVPAVTGLAGILVGGGIQTRQSRITREAEATAVLQAVVAEVDSLIALIRHRKYLQVYEDASQQCLGLVEAGQGEELLPAFMLVVTEDYFSTYNALASKIGMLSPYHADRIVRFYTFAKAAKESFKPGAPHSSTPQRASEMASLLEQEIPLMVTLLRLGDEIATFVPRDQRVGSQYVAKLGVGDS